MIWGCDPASKKIAMFTEDGPGNIHSELITVKKSNRNDELMELRRQLMFTLSRDPNPTIYCEEPVVAGARNIRSTILVAETVGMILALNAHVRVVPVSSWKKATVGKGNATKDEVTEWLRREHPDYASNCHESQDLTDAAAIFIYGRGLEVGP